MLRITAMPGYGERFVLPALEKLRTLYEDIDFDVNFTDQVINLASNDVDIARGAIENLNLHEITAPEMHQLSEQTGEAIYLAIREDMSVIYINLPEGGEALLGKLVADAAQSVSRKLRKL